MSNAVTYQLHELTQLDKVIKLFLNQSHDENITVLFSQLQWGVFNKWIFLWMCLTTITGDHISKRIY